MSLTLRDKETVKLFWNKVAHKVEDVGNDAFSRLLVVYPQTKTYFSHWSSLAPGSPSVKKHGTTVLLGIGEAVKKMDDLEKGLLTLSELHAFQLRVDPANFKLLSHCILVVLAIIFPIEFTPEAHVAVDKFLAAVSRALSDKYR